MSQTASGHVTGASPAAALRGAPSANDAVALMAADLCERYRQVAGQSTSGRPMQTARDLKRLSDWLVQAHSVMRVESQQEGAISSASEWILDNFYIIRQAIRQVEEDLPAGYYRRLP
ncbi:MAG: hypothetical protein ACYCYF_09875, partial [Anaerolineae bacterium]